ncbi:MAG: outer membrane protein transport protein [Polyangiaceae bacterium]|nr:outer membrane protein transport protein [Polyangiaceae bacterium]MCW5791709.1 outer membrane protein transport protein [Polyangiaceae bacterium]
MMESISGRGRRGVLRRARLGTLACGAALASASLTTEAQATSALEVPEQGAQQMARGGAWVARASSPLAAAYNPAALAGIRSGVTLGTNLVFNRLCFSRKNAAGEPEQTRDGVEYQESCNENSGTPNFIPHLAGNLRITDDLGIGLAVLPPSMLGKIEFAETEKGIFRGREVDVASPGRYVLLKADGLLLNPVLSVGYALSDRLRLGAGFIFGFGSLKLANTAMAQPTANDELDAVAGDVKAEVEVFDAFVPGVIIGGLFSVNENLDLGLSVRIQDAFRGKGDLVARSGYWNANGRVAPDGGTASSSADRGEDLVSLTIPNPITVRAGAAFRVPRDGSPGYLTAGAMRDPISQDIFDVEIDLEYTRNSAIDAIQVRIPRETVYIYSRGLDGSANEVGPVPENADVELHFKDTFGVRLGGDYVALPDLLAVRAGAWYQSAAATDEYLHFSPMASARLGLSAGAQLRAPFVDVEVGYMWVHMQTMDNGGKGAIKTISGNQSLGSRSPYAVNGGSLTGNAHVVSVAVTSNF